MWVVRGEGRTSGVGSLTGQMLFVVHEVKGIECPDTIDRYYYYIGGDRGVIIRQALQAKFVSDSISLQPRQYSFHYSNSPLYCL